MLYEVHPGRQRKVNHGFATVAIVQLELTHSQTWLEIPFKFRQQEPGSPLLMDLIRYHAEVLAATATTTTITITIITTIITITIIIITIIGDLKI